MDNDESLYGDEPIEFQDTEFNIVPQGHDPFKDLDQMDIPDKNYPVDMQNSQMVSSNEYSLRGLLQNEQSLDDQTNLFDLK